MFVEGPGDSQADSAAASQDGFTEKFIRMETIFDHNVTEDELKWLLNYPYTQKEYLDLIGNTDDHLVHIAELYFHRGKKFKAKRYINKVTDQNLRNSFWRTVTHP